MLASCKNENAKTVVTENKVNIISANAKLAITNFKIEGMTCEVGCAKTIEKVLNKTLGVKLATVNFNKKTAKVEYDSNTQTPEKLAKLVEKTGDGKTYKVTM